VDGQGGNRLILQGDLLDEEVGSSLTGTIGANHRTITLSPQFRHYAFRLDFRCQQGYVFCRVKIEKKTPTVWSTNQLLLSPGIGRGLVEQYLVRDNTTVVAAVRNPQSAEAKELSSLPTGTGSKLIVVKVDAGSDTDALEAVKSIKAEDVTSLDIVIANAGIFDTTAFVPTAEAVLWAQSSIYVICDALLELADIRVTPRATAYGRPVCSSSIAASA
jgi:hypothetical protein